MYYLVLSEYSCSSALIMAANEGGGEPSLRLSGLDNFCHPNDLHVMMKIFVFHSLVFSSITVFASICYLRMMVGAKSTKPSN